VRGGKRFWLSLILLKIELRKVFFTTYASVKTGLPKTKKERGMCDSFLGEGGGRGLTSYAIADYMAKPLPAFALISARPSPR
jgi:hypothetical protein